MGQVTFLAFILFTEFFKTILSQSTNYFAEPAETGLVNWHLE